MNKAELEAFLAVVQMGNFTRAAQHLNLSQSALSRRISILETSVGAPLIERRKGQAGLAVATKAGHALFRHAEAVLIQFQLGLDAIRATTQEEDSAIVLGFCSPLCGPDMIEPLVAMRKLYPRLDLSLRNGSSRKVSELVNSGEAAIGLRYRKDPDRNISSTVIGHEETVVICSPDHRLLQYPVVQPEELAKEVWIAVPTRSDEPGSGVPAYLAQFGLVGHRIMPIDDTADQTQLIEAGFGIGLMTRANVERKLQSGRLRILNVPQLIADLPIVMIHKKGAYLSKPAERLRTLLKEAYGRASTRLAAAED